MDAIERPALRWQTREGNRTISTMPKDFERIDNPLQTSVIDRPAAPHVPCTAEVVMVWHHDLANLVSYEVTEVTDQAMRIHAETPLPKGMTGTATRMLPANQALNVSLTVAWCELRTDRGGYYVELHRL